MSTSQTVYANGTAYDGAKVLGTGTSYNWKHTHEGDYLPPGLKKDGKKVRCPACRWQTVTIYAVGKEHYLLVNTGQTTVSGETTYEDVLYTSHEFEVLERLIVRNREGAFLTSPARTALAQAASNDEGMLDVYRNMPVGL